MYLLIEVNPTFEFLACGKTYLNDFKTLTKPNERVLSLVSNDQLKDCYKANQHFEDTISKKKLQ